MDVRSAGSTPADESTRRWSTRWTSSGSIVEGVPEAPDDEVVGGRRRRDHDGLRRRLPDLSGKRYLDWDLPDRSGRSVEDVRPIRDEIDRRVRRC